MPSLRTFSLLLIALLCGSAGIHAAARERVIRLHNIHTNETVEVVYKRDGKYLPDGLKQASWALRDWRRNEATEMDPALIDLLWELHAELGSQEPIHIISGYRSRATNDMLRKTVGGQASESRHILGKAADVYFPDVPLKRLRYSALVREKGGVGYYPTSGTPFVHVDTDRVRAWPRLPRPELALLFPGGSTQHIPADGQPLKPEDVRIAQVQHQDLAREIALHRSQRRDPVLAEVRPADARPARPPMAVAALVPPPQPQPALRAAPALAARPARATPEVAKLGSELPPAPPMPAVPRLPPERPTDLVVAGAPAFDEDHPDELSYRPFAVAPLMNDDPDVTPGPLAMLKAPDIVRTLDLIEGAETLPALRFGSTRERLASARNTQFRGPAVAVNLYFGR